MKKLILLVVALFITITLSAQAWETVNVEDEFGDPTGKTAKIVLIEGVFSNSATSNERMTVKIADYGNAALITLYEYNRAPGASIGYSSEFGTISVKDDAGSVIKLKAFAPKSGGLYFSKKDYTSFIATVIPGCRVFIKGADFNSSGTWAFKWLK